MGDVLMVVGVIGLVMALIWMAAASRRTPVTPAGYEPVERP